MRPGEKLVYAIGDSHVRTYSYHDHFLPLYIGPGFANCFLTAELAAAAEVKILLNAARLRAGHLLLFVLGEPDVRFHCEDRFGTRQAGDESALRSAVGRYAAVLRRVRERCKFELAVLSVPPSVDAERCALAALYNGFLAEHCAAAGVAFIDVWQDLADRVTGLLHHDFDADGIHLTAATLPAVIRALRDSKLVGHAFPAGANFEWTFNYRIPLSGAIETRFWGNKVNTAQADKLAAHVFPAAVAPSTTAAVLNCREGYIALALASRGVGRVAASDQDPAKRRLAIEVMRFAERPQVEVLEPDAVQRLRYGRPFSVVIDYSPGRSPDTLSPKHLERLAALGNRVVLAAPRTVLPYLEACAGDWRIDDSVFGSESDDIIMVANSK